MEPTGVARTYYAAIDDGDYERLASVLAPGFVQYRPDLTLEGRDRFVRFMREERPRTDTTHAVEGTFTDAAGDVAVEGRLLTAEGHSITTFVDVFVLENDVIAELRTYSR